MKYLLLLLVFALPGCKLEVTNGPQIGQCYLHADPKPRTISKVKSLFTYENGENYVGYDYSDGQSNGDNTRPNNDNEWSYKGDYGFSYKYPKQIDCSEYESLRTQKVVNDLKQQIEMLDSQVTELYKQIGLKKDK